MTRPYNNLVLAAAKLSAHSQAWDEFLRAMGEYREEALTHMMQGAPDLSHILQGRARGISDLLILFSECRDKAKVIMEKPDAR